MTVRRLSAAQSHERPIFREPVEGINAAPMSNTWKLFGCGEPMGKIIDK